ncbi:hypothetical protein [Pseudomonas lijiangensis]|uniref:Uncharacterized protein n=1 Tax=Pseudomonas lijiangensis TaxID=2995658 RepID=A0ABX8HYI8_9PSED|nr:MULTISPECIES: hypothetical protein [Pseudomonas syringae group]MBX8490795.1 hypothetical protein [Pseudomonas cichorii]MBX8499267.1 hypothetical protein [Pseudomonas lijiangensis]MBX8504847.1 hypothetical protein [Pseudomonas lijiangensis]MBX8518243.1 hypothetical protein [Pseudomonas cichorii]QWU85010.1 hypothetical protein KQP88_09690 [Pseudomonas lijiangensis]
MQIPDALQPWREWLEWFSPDLWPGFSDILGRVNPLLGPLHGVQAGGTPDLEGLADLQRRGPYERLLTSEWLLADELPEEFLRRASTGEHLFLAPEQRARKANRQVVVLFDAGPLQWGAPRLVHLALMILLARRAQAAGGELKWGVVQNPGKLASLTASSSLKNMLQARTDSPATAQQWEQWRDWLGEQPQTPGECWAVGLWHDREAVLPAFTHRVHLQRTLDGTGIQLDLYSRNPQRVILPMPNQTAGQKLLKGQFETRSSTARAPDKSARVALTCPPVISPSGSYVALMLLDEPGSLVFRVPQVNQKKAQSGHRQLWSAGLKPVAAYFIGNKFAAVLSNAANLHFWKMACFQGIRQPLRETFLIPTGTATLQPCVWLHDRSRLYCLDKQGKLIYWGNDQKQETRLTSVEQGVIGLARIGQETLAYLKNESGRLFLKTCDSRDTIKTRSVPGSAADATQVLFAGSPKRRSDFVPCAVYHTTDGAWHVHSCAADPLHTEIVSLNSGHQPVGLLYDTANDQWSLVLISAGKTTVSLYREHQVQTLFTTSTPIVRQSFCPVSGLLAVLTETRELLVFSVRENAMRLQVLCNGVSSQETAS